MVTSITDELASQGVSIWLDDLSRGRLDDGALATLIRDFNVVGVTTNPAIFAQAIATDPAYEPGLAASLRDGSSAESAVTRLVVEDVQRACDVLRPVFEASDGEDGRVSLEVEPAFAHDAEATTRRAAELWNLVDRENAMIKIPATDAGIQAISQVIALGISVNVTLIFGLPRYREVVNAYLVGLELAREAQRDISRIRSVASFFVSRLDSAIDPKLDAQPSRDTDRLRGRAGIANARLAYEAFQDLFSSARAEFLMNQGAHPQRLLWASTGVKDPRYPDTMYVDELVGRQVVNTMPEATLRAVADHGSISGDTVSNREIESNQVLNELERFEINYTEITQQLEVEGLGKFEESWNGLIRQVEGQFERAAQ